MPGPAGRFPSYQRYCPYTAGAEDGAWHGPDLATAVRLAHESGTTQVPVDRVEQPDRLRQTCRRLPRRSAQETGIPGHRAQCVQPQYHAAVHNSSRKIQLGLSGWGSRPSHRV